MYYFLPVIIALATWAFIIYNRLVHFRNQVKSAWSDIDVQLNRRHTLIPQLINTAKAYKEYEQSALTLTTLLRTQSTKASHNTEVHTQELAENENQISQLLGKLLFLQEDYPDLKASDSFIQLMTELTDTEDKLQYARRFYNGAVRQLNTEIEQFPYSIVAKTGGFSQASFFELESAEMAQPVQVKLDG